jgi:hypothetical protein
MRADSGAFCGLATWHRGCFRHGMDENDLKARLDTLDARLAEMRQLILAVEKVEKIVLTEVRGLATKVDRLTRPRGRSALISNS